MVNPSQIITRDEARASGLKRYFDGKPCIRDHLSERWTYDKRCAECKLLTKVPYDKSHKEQRAAYDKARPPRLDRIRKPQPLGTLTPEERDHKNASWRKFASNNRDSRNYYESLRRASKLRRTPTWADKKKIREIYKSCSELTKASGIEYHVDHIIPLRGETVSGLHVEYNLQILPKYLNLMKSNSYPPPF